MPKLAASYPHLRCCIDHGVAETSSGSTPDCSSGSTSVAQSSMCLQPFLWLGSWQVFSALCCDWSNVFWCHVLHQAPHACGLLSHKLYFPYIGVILPWQRSYPTLADSRVSSLTPCTLYQWLHVCGFTQHIILPWQSKKTLGSKCAVNLSGHIGADLEDRGLCNIPVTAGVWIYTAQLHSLLIQTIFCKFLLCPNIQSCSHNGFN